MARLKRVLAVLCLDPTIKFGSMEEHALTLARAFKARGSVFVPAFSRPVNPEAAAEYATADLPVETLDLSRLGAATFRRVLQVVRRYDIEVIHWHFYDPFNPYLWLLSASAPRLEHFRTDHHSRAWPSEPRSAPVRDGIKRTLLKRYSKVVCVSGFVFRCCEREGVWSNLTQCDHFVNTSRFRPDPVVRSRVRREAAASDHFVALVVANLIPEKGVDLALRALTRLPSDVRLWVAGDGSDAARLAALTSDLGLGGRVRFLGNQQDVAHLMQAADCLVCPSIWEEAAGLVNLEALACGLPVVASAVGGIPEFVDDGESGLLFPRGDDRQLADRLATLYRDRHLANRLARCARERALARFSPERRMEDFLALYRVADGA